MKLAVRGRDSGPGYMSLSLVQGAGGQKCAFFYLRKGLPQRYETLASVGKVAAVVNV